MMTVESCVKPFVKSIEPIYNSDRAAMLSKHTSKKTRCKLRNPQKCFCADGKYPAVTFYGSVSRGYAAFRQFYDGAIC